MQAVLKDFRTSLDRIRDVAHNISFETAAALGNSAVLRRHETIQYASTVILSGYFESFLRDLARAFARDVSRLAVPFGTLPATIRHSHFEYGGQVLANTAKAERTGKAPRFPTNTNDLAGRLQSVTSTVPYDLVWEAFAHTGANPGPDVVKEYLGRMGVKEVWPTLEVKTTAAAAHQTATWIKAKLASFIAIRNDCAHGGGSTVQVLPSDLRDYCEMFERLASAMVAVLEDIRQAIAAATQPSGATPAAGAPPAASPAAAPPPPAAAAPAASPPLASPAAAPPAAATPPVSTPPAATPPVSTPPKKGS